MLTVVHIDLMMAVTELGSDCIYVDKEFDDDHDLLDQSFWENLSLLFLSMTALCCRHPAAALLQHAGVAVARLPSGASVDMIAMD